MAGDRSNLGPSPVPDSGGLPAERHFELCGSQPGEAESVARARILGVMRLRGGLLSLLLLVSVLRAGSPCAIVEGEGYKSTFNEETVALVWDAPAHREHLIRKASFSSKSKDLGFLVPTPTRPELHDASDWLFSHLDEVTIPPDPVLVVVSATPALIPGAGVEVLEERELSGYKAAVLRANDAGALQKWLGSNGYRADAKLQSWIQHYVEKGYFFTAFKVANPQAEELLLKPVRLTFTSDRPYFPYRQPTSAGHQMKLFFLSNQRYQGQLEDGSAWKAKVAFSDEFAATQLLPPDYKPTWVTRFQYDGDRGGGDLFFNPSDAGPYPRTSWLRGGFMLGLCGALLGQLYWRRPRLKKRT